MTQNINNNEFFNNDPQNQEKLNSTSPNVQPFEDVSGESVQFDSAESLQASFQEFSAGLAEFQQVLESSLKEAERINDQTDGFKELLNALIEDNKVVLEALNNKNQKILILVEELKRLKKENQEFKITLEFLYKKLNVFKNRFLTEE